MANMARNPKGVIVDSADQGAKIGDERPGPGLDL